MTLILILSFISTTLAVGQTIPTDWDSVIRGTILSEKEIIRTIKELDSLIMGGEKIKILPNYNDAYDFNPYLYPKEYSYSNMYEYQKACNKFTGSHNFPGLTINMVDSLVPIINLSIIGHLSVSKLCCQYSYSMYLWHPEVFLPFGIINLMTNTKIPSYTGEGEIIGNSNTKAFVNEFIDSPYSFNIKISPPQRKCSKLIIA